MRAPVVAGVGGGVGTTTVAVGLRGHDAGRAAGLPPGHHPDILVCRATSDSVQRAAAVLDGPGHAPPPVLAVTLTGPRAPRGPLRARLELLEPGTAAVVLLPHVRRWGALVDPLAEAAHLLVAPAAQLPRPLRAYAAALRELAAAVANSGRLGHDAAATGLGRSSDDRHSGRTGPDERVVRRDGHGRAGPPTAPRPGVAGPARPVQRRAPGGTSRAGLLPADQAPQRVRTSASSDVDGAPTDPTPRGPRRRRGVQIVAPDGPRPGAAIPTGPVPDVPAAAGGTGRPARRVAPGAPPAAAGAAVAGAGDRQPGRTDVDVPAERVGQVG